MSSENKDDFGFDSSDENGIDEFGFEGNIDGENVAEFDVEADSSSEELSVTPSQQNSDVNDDITSESAVVRNKNLFKRATEWVSENRLIAGSAAAAVLLGVITVTFVSTMSTQEPDVQYAEIDFGSVDNEPENQKSTITPSPVNSAKEEGERFKYEQPSMHQVSQDQVVPDNSDVKSLKSETEQLDRRYMKNEEFEQYRNSVAKVTQEELDVFLTLSKDNYDEIRRLKQSGRNDSKIEEQLNLKIDRLNERLSKIEASVKKNVDLVEKHEKNQGWLFNRVKKLESGDKKTQTRTHDKRNNSQTGKDSVSTNWEVRGITYDRAFITHVNKGQRMKVFVGTTVPGFGTVVRFDARNERIYTTMGVIL